MILTVTMNPCFDRYDYTPSLKHGKTNRITDEYYCAAGKGINVSKMLAALGINVLACGVACEDIIKTIENDLGEYRISSDFIKADGNTRVNMKIRDDSGVVTELSEGGLSVNADVEKRAYMHVTRLAENASLCVLSGSVPKGINGNFYFDVISRLKSIGCECVLDASGELLANGIKAGPAIVKPNLEEFEQLCGAVFDSVWDIADAAKKMANKYGISAFVVSLGSRGAIITDGNDVFFAKAPDVSVKKTTGAGDAMFAGMISAYCEGLENDEILKRGTVAAAALVSSEPGAMITPDDLKKYSDKAEIRKL